METNSVIKEAAFDDKRAFFDSGATLSYAFRIEMLKSLQVSLKSAESEIYEALKKDMHKSSTESYATELMSVYKEISVALSELKGWMKPRKKHTPIWMEPASSKVIHEPKGVVLIISPWNYPIRLVFMPLVGAIAAGNCAIVKPSEVPVHAEAVIRDIISRTFKTNYISVVLGDGGKIVPTLTEAHAFNHIFFTGSPQVGALVAGAAAKKLTSTTLELGGKSPAVIDMDANLSVAARRLAWGKYNNAGQTCVAPDYALVHKSVHRAFLTELRKTITAFYGADPKASPDYARMVNAKHFATVKAMLGDGEILLGGEHDESERYIAPTVMVPKSLDTDLMRKEIFGPILSIITWEKRDELLDVIRRNRYPLAFYYFGRNRENEKFLMERVEFGGSCVNNAVVHLGNPDLPFGGVQGSGSGHYNGWYSFEAFSNAKSVLKSATWIDPVIKYPPYSPFRRKWLKRILGL